jgi:predicted small secreted protein
MKKVWIVQLVIASSLLLGAAACKKKAEHGEGSLESAGEDIKEGAKDASDATEEAAEDTGDKVEEAVD